MKKIIFIIFAVIVLTGVKDGYSGGNDNVFTSLDSLKRGSDTTRTINIEATYNERFKFEVLSWRDTGSTFIDSVKVYAILDNGDLTPCNLIDCSTHLDGVATSGAGQTKSYLIYFPYAKGFKIVWNGNATYTANVKGWFQLQLSND